MTREEFREDYTSFEALRELCSENGYSCMDDVLSDDEYNCAVNDDISAFTGDWESLRDFLTNLPSCGDAYWFRRDGAFDYKPLGDEDIEDYISTVEEYLDWDDYFDDDEEDDADEYADDDDNPDDVVDTADMYSFLTA